MAKKKSKPNKNDHLLRLQGQRQFKRKRALITPDLLQARVGLRNMLSCEECYVLRRKDGSECRTKSPESRA